MLSYKILVLALLSYGAKNVVAAKPPATLFTEETCLGDSFEVAADGKCVLLPENLQKDISAAEVPEDVVCDFYTDEKCNEPLWIGMEGEDKCMSFSPLEISNKTVSVHCYDADSIYD
ncbi:hypothetical protein N7478_003146 [Penicillium angulare]|uniref:uncharacterized protein n=1 Tax=Penicillium angulare TaxID=116970 RepID=UPI002541AF0B|nr:uncharacterized protein N7478_003146 [Penicillium angulare]KAJ5287460.1 hypothetical protein N7478_003146 [Penicillium angulare]